MTGSHAPTSVVSWSADFAGDAVQERSDTSQVGLTLQLLQDSVSGFDPGLAVQIAEIPAIVRLTT